MVTHINHALVPKTHPPLYMIHKYWARKPHNVVAEYIKHYTQPSDIVLDPFCGSGVTVIEALRNDRIAIGFDLDPLSAMIIESSVEAIDSKKFDRAFNNVLASTEERINSLYRVKCPKCGAIDPVTRYVVWTHLVSCPSCQKEIMMSNAKRPKGKSQNIYNCPHCNETFSYANVPIMGETPISVTIDCDSATKQAKSLILN